MKEKQPITGGWYNGTFKKQTRSKVYFDVDGTEVVMDGTELDRPIGKETDVFIYETKSGDPAATMQEPVITTASYDWVDVVDVIDAGVFVHIGMPKDVLVSKDDLPDEKERWPKRGDRLFCTLGHDRKGRLKALPVQEEIVDQERDRADKKILGAEVKGNVYKLKEAGALMITEDGYRTFIHHSLQPFPPRLGQLLQGKVIEVKPDGTLNVTLMDDRVVSQGRDADKILEVLEERGGEMPFTDKSTPAEIEAAFGMSKAAFKRALGRLLKEQKAAQEPGVRTYLMKD
ncbi:hypothetical protein [Alkalicoccus chagannorensis]|uniref:hypothetical protein n=1 Tax=Alkalicoccus chagannorensis TaxID=427072 RepID=UPI00042A0C2D|nr:hypothetical protein [Alkalicoccus chagannorensis]